MRFDYTCVSLNIHLVAPLATFLKISLGSGELWCFFTLSPSVLRRLSSSSLRNAVSRSSSGQLSFYTLDMVKIQSELTEVGPPFFKFNLLRRGTLLKKFSLAPGHRGTR